jgi:protein-S-isoprenylcysteine O-methyltransferase Ste14
MAIALLAHLALWGLTAPYGRLLWVGLAMEALGLAWMLWAAWCLRAAGTSIRPTERPRRLVDEGPFRFGRNPMVLGMTVAMLGLALKFGVPTLAAAGATFALFMHRLHIPREEAQLHAAFGGWYSDYAASVRRWL